MIGLAPELTQSRLIDELSAIATRYPQFRMLPLEGRPPTFEGALEVEGASHRVRLTLPPGYPRIPPQVRELEPTTGEEKPADGRPYRLPGWGLCLFPHGPNARAWRPDRYAVEALDRFVEFMQNEATQESEVQLARDRLHLPPGIVDLLHLGPGRLLARRGPHGGDLYVTGIRFARHPDLDFDRDAEWREFLPIEIEIPWFVIGSKDRWRQVAGDVQKLDATLQRELSPADYREHRAGQWLLLARPTGSEVDMACLHRSMLSIGTLLEVSIVRDTLEGRLFDRVDGAVAGRDALGEETVVIVGLGSLGSAIALALAGAGAQRFVLIDGDTLTLENVCRHIGTLRDLSRLKVEVVGDAIRSVNPAAHVECIPKWLAWDLPWLAAGAEFEEIVSGNDRCLVVSATAEATMERQLNALAIRAGVPVIYASALGAAEHGRVFRVCPGKSACLECILVAQDLEPTRYPRFITVGADEEGTPAYGGAGSPGLGIDIHAIALIAARFALQTIAELRGLDLGMPLETGDHLMWSNRGGWLFDRPQQLLVEHFPKSVTCPVCGPRAEPDRDADDEETTRRLQALLAELRRR